MASTTVKSLIDQVRTPLKDFPADRLDGKSYWGDPEILLHLNNGAKILWRAIVDLYDHHFTVVDEENFFIEASTKIIYGVPETVHRITSLEPRVLGESNPNRSLIFKPANWNSDLFTQARAQAATSPTNAVIYYTLMAAGAPVGPPVIRIAPALTSSMLLTCTYVSTIAPFDETDRNPIPGESDQALINYAVAQCRAKEREDSMPDPGWMALFATERTDLLVRLDKRQEQAPDIVEGMFDGTGDGGYM